MAFTGRATDSPDIFAEQPEDVSRLVSIISPHETPFLDLIGDAQMPTGRVYHEWLEESLQPNALALSANVSSAAAGDSTPIPIAGGLGEYIMVGTVLEHADTEEQVRVTAVGANTVTVERGFAGTTANSAASGSYYQLIGEAMLEGRDVDSDISRSRPRQGNYTQIFERDVMISGTEAAALNIGIGSEVDHQVRNRLKEAMIALERATIRARVSGNTIGGAASVRTMKGLLQFISTNNNSFGAFDEAHIKTSVNQAWLNGGTDLDVLVCGSSVKEEFDQLNASRVRVVNEEGKFRERVLEYENTYGIYALLLARWMPARKIVGVASGRMAIVPFLNRSYHFEQTAKTGDSTKGFVIGEYTMELRNEAGMWQSTFHALPNQITP